MLLPLFALVQAGVVLPPWPATWMMNESTIIQPCNYSGYASNRMTEASFDSSPRGICSITYTSTRTRTRVFQHLHIAFFPPRHSLHRMFDAAFGSTRLPDQHLHIAFFAPHPSFPPPCCCFLSHPPSLHRPFDPAFASKFGIVDYDWSNMKQLWATAHPMDCEKLLVTQVKLSNKLNPKSKAFVYRNLVKALNWFGSVREKLDDPAYSGFFLKFDPNKNGSYHVPACDANYSPPKCSVFYHDQEQTPEPRNHWDSCGKGPCDCGKNPCGTVALFSRHFEGGRSVCGSRECQLSTSPCMLMST